MKQKSIRRKNEGKEETKALGLLFTNMCVCSISIFSSYSSRITVFVSTVITAKITNGKRDFLHVSGIMGNNADNYIWSENQCLLCKVRMDLCDKN